MFCDMVLVSDMCVACEFARSGVPLATINRQHSLMEKSKKATRAATQTTGKQQH